MIQQLICACMVLMLLACNGNGLKQDRVTESGGQRQEGFYRVEAGKDAGAKAPRSQSASANPMEQPAKMKNVQEIILKRKGYITSYNPKTKIPNWVAWHLTKEHCDGKIQRHTNVFHEDEDVAYPRVTDDDYFNSGFDRGHMCPAGDNKWDVKAMNETFLFTNVCPQVHGFNSGAWNDLEMACRSWARKYGDIYIVCGPLLNSGAQHRTIGRNKVVVPERFFKVILCTSGTPKAIGFLYDNSNRNSRSLFKNATNVDEIEKLTGIDFFPNLRDDIERDVEAVRGYF
ncbi:MAG: DNA/RNA non-specific endonuclease [Prevotella sp.]|nr:DNA/RNA non-specific endonuclease [Prevotella sp.]